MSLKISIITATYNSAATVEDTLRSVVEQDYADIEYIIIDGLSKDRTLEIVKKYEHRIAKIVSEKDKGIFDAFNKGIKSATGDVVAILNSDDFYAAKNIISLVAETFEKTKSDTVYGDLVYVDPINTDKILRYWKSLKYDKKLFRRGWMPPHPTFFVKRELYEKYGLFNTFMKISNDYEMVLRLLYKNNASSVYIPETLVKMRAGGNSNGSLRKRIIANIEDRQSWKINGLKMPFGAMTLKPLRKIFQFFVHK